MQFYKLKYTFIVLFIFSFSRGFSQTDVTITIDSICFQNSNAVNLDGQFGLYGTQIAAGNSWRTEDTLLQLLEFKPTQTLSLPQMEYSLRFIPNDTSYSEHEIHFYPSQRNVVLNSFFFNISYPNFLENMKSKDYIQITTRYSGPTNMSTSIPAYTVIILKKGRKFYATYAESFYREQDVLISEIHPYYYQKGFFKRTKDFIQLTNEDLIKINEFESKLGNFVLPENIGGSYTLTYTSINSKNGYSHFHSKGYISRVLWEKIGK